MGEVVNAILRVAVDGSQWRMLPKEYRQWASASCRRIWNGPYIFARLPGR